MAEEVGVLRYVAFFVSSILFLSLGCFGDVDIDFLSMSPTQSTGVLIGVENDLHVEVRVEVTDNPAEYAVFINYRYSCSPSTCRETLEWTVLEPGSYTFEYDVTCTPNCSDPVGEYVWFWFIAADVDDSSKMDEYKAGWQYKLPPPPNVTVGLSPSIPEPGDAVTFTDRTNALGEITERQWLLDGVPMGSGPSVTVMFDEVSSHTVTLRLRVACDRTWYEETRRVDVRENTSITGSIQVGDVTPVAGDVVTFSARSLRSNSGERFESYSWDFRDGVTASGVEVSHAFESAGTYYVRVTVCTEPDACATEQSVVVVSGKAATAQESPQQAPPLTTPPEPGPSTSATPQAAPLPSVSVPFDEQPRVLFDEAHGEINTLSELHARTINRAHPDWYYCGELSRELSNRYRIERVLEKTIPGLRDSYDVMVIGSPTEAFSESELEEIAEFVQQGGGLIVIQSSHPLEDLGSNQVAALFGARFRSCVICSQSGNWDDQSFLAELAIPEHPAVGGAEAFQMNWGCSIDAPPEFTVLFETPADTWQDTDCDEVWDEGELKGPLTVAVAADVGCGRVVLVGDNSFHDSIWEINRAFFEGMLAWVSEERPCVAQSQTRPVSQKEQPLPEMEDAPEPHTDESAGAQIPSIDASIPLSSIEWLASFDDESPMSSDNHATIIHGTDDGGEYYGMEWNSPEGTDLSLNGLGRVEYEGAESIRVTLAADVSMDVDIWITVNTSYCAPAWAAAESTQILHVTEVPTVFTIPISSFAHHPIEPCDQQMEGRDLEQLGSIILLPEFRAGKLRVYDVALCGDSPADAVPPTEEDETAQPNEMTVDGVLVSFQNDEQGASESNFARPLEVDELNGALAGMVWNSPESDLTCWVNADVPAAATGLRVVASASTDMEIRLYAHVDCDYLGRAPVELNQA